MSQATNNEPAETPSQVRATFVRYDPHAEVDKTYSTRWHPAEDADYLANKYGDDAGFALAFREHIRTPFRPRRQA